MMTEKDIIFECGNFWVCKISGLYHVMKNKSTYAESVCAFDDLSLAIAHASYNGKKRNNHLSRKGRL